MRKLFLSLIALILATGFAWAKPVSESQARQVAEHFYAEKVNAGVNWKNLTITLAYAASVPSQSHSLTADNAYYFVYNVGGNNGFIIVSGDDVAMPILAYTSESRFTQDNLPANFRKWMEGYKKEIQYAQTYKLEATDEVSRAWEMYRTGRQNHTLGGGSSVSPLMATKWNQAPYYNDACPYDAQYGAKSVTGCVATAMAQVMKYWNYPEQGQGFHSYNHPKFGTLSANFGATTYHWNQMPSTLSSTNSAISTLMLHCGVSVDMNYSAQSSGAYVISAASAGENCAEYAFKTYFSYKTSARGLERDNYGTIQWTEMVKSELDAHRPVLYAGFGNGGGHAFVCDGYDENGFFHFNWGWGGAEDGYFALNALNPGSLGTGGGSGGYNYNQQAIFGLEPPQQNPNQGTADVKLFDYITVSANPINYGQAFTIHTDVVNRSQSTFSGDYAAALFDQQGILVDFVQTYTGNSLEPGYHYTSGIDFSTSGLASVTPGTYQIGILYRTTGREWKLAGSENGYENLRTIQVVYENDIEMYASMVVTPAEVIRNQAVSVKLDVGNFGWSEFNGKFSLDLYNLNGDHVASIEEKSNMSLCTDCHYTDGLTFSTSKLDVAPGTYLLALMKQGEGENWQLVGSTYYTNPIRIVVKAAADQPDAYEANNSESAAYNFNAAFNNNKAVVRTTGSNIHNAEDEDYYSIALPEGYVYTIKARVHDAYSSGNGQSYTNDVLFSYKLNGELSEVYDDMMPSEITVEGGTAIVFRVAPYFAGELGTYLLDVELTRRVNGDGGSTGIETPEEVQSISLYPNPAKDQVTIELPEPGHRMDGLRILDLSGKVVYEMPRSNGSNSKIQIPLGQLQPGMYIVQVETDKGRFTQRFNKVQ